MKDSKELKQEEMAKATGGVTLSGYVNDQDTCPHNGGYKISESFRNYGYDDNIRMFRASKQKRYCCKLCGSLFWEDEVPNR